MAKKWSVLEDGSLQRLVKHRFTTDDSWSSFQTVVSRNDGIDVSMLPELKLPSARDLARAAAILTIPADEAGVPVKAWARDLKAAYRMWGAQAASLWLQCFLWTDGVRVDERLEFGTASAVQIFERLASLLLAYARLLQSRWDREHPPSHPALRRWLASRDDARLSYSHIFIDDSSGVTVDDREAGWPGGRARAHFDIVGEVFRAAGFTVPPAKDQFGDVILHLGFRLSLCAGQRGLDYPPERNAALCALIADLLRAKSAAFKHVEEVVGILGHLATVLPEAKRFLDAGYAFLFARRHPALHSPRGRSRGTFRPPQLSVGGSGAVASSFRLALSWFQGALQEGLATPLAPRLTFPAPGMYGSDFAFMDASRDWGIGGWSLLASSPPTFLLIAAPYPPDLVVGARDTGATGISTGALELAAYAIVADQVAARTGGTSLLTFTDADAAKGAVNSGGSSAPAMRSLLLALFQSPRQHLAVRVSTSENKWADDASRGKAAAVAADAASRGWKVQHADVPDSCWDPLRLAWSVSSASVA